MAGKTAKVKSAKSAKDWIPNGDGPSYVDRVHRPLQCLIFIIPFLLIYQVGSALRQQVMAHLSTPGALQPRVDVVAFILMQRFFSLFGAAGNYLPLLSVVAILLAMHLARRQDKWELDPPLYSGMLAESIAWAIPVFVIGLAVFRRVGGVTQSATGDLGQLDMMTEGILSVGAGVYEELLFRLIGITLLNMMFMDVFAFKRASAIPLVIISSAVLFSAYHYMGAEGALPFNMSVFLFRTMAGIYFAGVYVFRGFGIVVGAHAIYDLIVVGLGHH